MNVDGDKPFPDDPFPAGHDETPWPPETVRGCIMTAGEITAGLVGSPKLEEEVGLLSECLFKAMQLLDKAMAAAALLEKPAPPVPLEELTRYRVIHDP